MEQFNVDGHSVSVTKSGHDMGDVSHWLRGLHEQVVISVTTDDGTEYQETYKPRFCFAGGIISVEPKSLRKGGFGDYFVFDFVVVKKEFFLVPPYRRQRGCLRTEQTDKFVLLERKTKLAT